SRSATSERSLKEGSVDEGTASCCSGNAPLECRGIPDGSSCCFGTCGSGLSLGRPRSFLGRSGAVQRQASMRDHGAYGRSEPNGFFGRTGLLIPAVAAPVVEAALL